LWFFLDCTVLAFSIVFNRWLVRVAMTNALSLSVTFVTLSLEIERSWNSGNHSILVDVDIRWWVKTTTHRAVTLMRHLVPTHHVKPSWRILPSSLLLAIQYRTIIGRHLLLFIPTINLDGIRIQPTLLMRSWVLLRMSTRIGSMVVLVESLRLMNRFWIKHIARIWWYHWPHSVLRTRALKIVLVNMIKLLRKLLQLLLFLLSLLIVQRWSLLKVAWHLNMSLHVLLVDQHLLLLVLVLLLVKVVFYLVVHPVLYQLRLVSVTYWCFLVQNCIRNVVTAAWVKLRNIDKFDSWYWIKVSEEDELCGLYEQLSFHLFLNQSFIVIIFNVLQNL
jgi:hypothetical protein